MDEDERLRKRYRLLKQVCAVMIVGTAVFVPLAISVLLWGLFIPSIVIYLAKNF
jgi:hypothetical protein